MDDDYVIIPDLGRRATVRTIVVPPPAPAPVPRSNPVPVPAPVHVPVYERPIPFTGPPPAVYVSPTAMSQGPQVQPTLGDPTISSTINYSPHLETNYSQNQSYYLKQGQGGGNPADWYQYPTQTGEILFDVAGEGRQVLRALTPIGPPFITDLLYNNTSILPNSWYDYPTLSGEVGFVDASGNHILKSIQGNLYYDGELLAKAGDIQNIADWSLYPMIHPIVGNGFSIGGVLDVSASGAITGASLKVTGDISGATLHISGAAAVGSLSSVGDISGATLHIAGAAAVGSLSSVGDISGATLHISGTGHIHDIDLSGCALTSNAGGTALFVNGVQVQTGTPVDVSQWSTFPAVSDVSMNGKNILGNGPLTISADTLTLSAGTALTLTRNATTKGIDMTGVINQTFAGSGGNYFQSGTQIGSNGVLPTDNLGTLAVYGGNVPTGLSSLYVKGGCTLDGTLTHGHTIGCLPAAGINTQRIDVLPVGILLTTPTFITMNGTGAANISMGGAIAIAAGSYVTLEHAAGLGSNGIFVQNAARDANAKMIFAFGGTISGVTDVSSATVHTGTLTASVDVSSAAVHTALLRTSETAIKLGFNAGTDASGNTVSIGNAPGLEQGGNSIAIGTGAGSLQGANCVAIGRLANAVPTAPYNNTIVLNATGVNVKAIADNSTYITPLRATSTQPSGTAYAMGYTSATSEVTASTTKITDIENTISNTQQISYDTGLLTTTIAGITQLQTVKANGPVTIGIPAALSTLTVAGTIAIQDASGNTATQVVAQPAFVYYVATNGKVGATGAITDPLSTINAALAKPASTGGGRAGMTIYVAPGAYTEDVVINISATLPAVSIIGMGDDNQSSKRVQLTGSVTVNGTDATFTNTIDTVILNNLLVNAKNTTTSAVTITGAGIRVTLKNGLFTNATIATVPLISLSSTGVLPSTVAQLVIDDCSLTMDSATASGHLISMTSGQLFTISYSDLTHKGTGSAINMAGGAFGSATQSAFNSNGAVMTIVQSAAGLTSLTNCLVAGKASTTVALITLGTNANLNLTDSTVQNLNTVEANNTSRYVYTTSATGNLIAAIRTNISNSSAATQVTPWQAAVPAASQLLYFGNIYSNQTATLVGNLPAQGGANWNAVRQFNTDTYTQQLQVIATSVTAIALTPTARGKTYILTGTTTQPFTTVGFGAADAGFFVMVHNGNASGGGDINITGATGTTIIHNRTATQNGGILYLYWTGAALVGY